MFRISEKNKKPCICDYLDSPCGHKDINFAWKSFKYNESAEENLTIIKAKMSSRVILCNKAFKPHVSYTVYENKNDESVTGKILRILQKVRDKKVLLFEDEQLMDYLLSYYDAIEEIDYICKRTREEFDDSFQLSLEIFIEPDSDSDERYLCLYVRQDQYADDIMKRIKKVRAAVRENPIIKRGICHLTTDFQPKR